MRRLPFSCRSTLIFSLLLFVRNASKVATAPIKTRAKRAGSKNKQAGIASPPGATAATMPAPPPSCQTLPLRQPSLYHPSLIIPLQENFRAVVENALSDRSECSFCLRPIRQGSLRLGARLSSDVGDFMQVRWYHPECFPSILRRAPKSVPDLGSISGLADLAPSYWPLALSGADLCDQPIPADFAKAFDRLRKANDMIDALSTPDMLSLMTANKVAFAGRPPERALLKRIAADGLAFGAPGPCPQCGGPLVYKQRWYSCMGYVDSLTHCDYRTRNIIRLPLTIPEAIASRYPTLAGLGVSQRPLFPGDPDAGELPFEDRPLVSCCFKGVRIAFEDPIDGSMQGLLRTGGADMAFPCSKAPKDFGSLFSDIIISRTKGESLPERFKGSKAIALPAEYIAESVALGYRIPYNALIDTPPGIALSKRTLAWRGRILAKAKEEDEEQKTVVVKQGIPVEKDSGLEDVAHVVDSYSVTLTKTDLVTGRNAYYIVQILAHDTLPNKFWLFRKWGRIGDRKHGDSRTQEMPYSRALCEFLSLFEEKSGCKWENRNNFVPKPGSYVFITTRIIDAVDEKDSKGSKPIIATSESTLPEATRFLIERLFDRRMIEATMQEMEIDTRKMPLGNIDEKTILKGYSALKNIQSVLDAVKSTGPTSEQARLLMRHSNQFYSHVPHIISRNAKQSALIDTREKLSAKNALLDDLRNIGVTVRLMQGHNTTDTYYKKLQTDMRLITSGEEWDMIKNAMNETRGKTHHRSSELLHLWGVSRHGEADRYKPFSGYDNRMLLWHGSRLTNWTGILSQGLRIAPPEAPVSGYMFGKGIYFADMFSKSENYSYTSSGEHALIALAEVALGNSAIRYHGDYIKSLPSDQHSVFARGRYCPTKFIHLKNGVRFPCGDVVIPEYKNSKGPIPVSLIYNEYIIYKEAQCNLKYLALIKF